MEQVKWWFGTALVMILIVLGAAAIKWYWLIPLSAVGAIICLSRAFWLWGADPNSLLHRLVVTNTATTASRTVFVLRQLDAEVWSNYNVVVQVADHPPANWERNGHRLQDKSWRKYRQFLQSSIGIGELWPTLTWAYAQVEDLNRIYRYRLIRRLRRDGPTIGGPMQKLNSGKGTLNSAHLALKAKIEVLDKGGASE